MFDPVRPLIAVDGLQKHYQTRHGVLKAVDDVSFHVNAGETLAVVGESGCGKTTLATSLLGLIPSSAGTISVDGEEKVSISSVAKTRLGRDMSVVFQNPQSSLNPKMRVRSSIGEPLTTAYSVRGSELSDRIAQLLGDVGLSAEHMNRYPHELSGGQLQRVAIARALALKPRLLILDEPTSALDVSVQAQILKLLKSLQMQRRVSYIFITHDLGAVEYIADRVMVMYLGKTVECGSVRQVFDDPRHPYTKALLDAVPTIDPARRGRMAPLNAEVPSSLNRGVGCAFAPRCSRSSERCHQTDLKLKNMKHGRAHACHHPLSSEPDRKKLEKVG